MPWCLMLSGKALVASNVIWKALVSNVVRKALVSNVFWKALVSNVGLAV